MAASPDATAHDGSHGKKKQTIGLNVQESFPFIAYLHGLAKTKRPKHEINQRR
jgi:hypothetical protein